VVDGSENMHRLRRLPQWDDQTSDEELIAWWNAGQREAMGLLYERYAGRVYGYAYRLLGSQEDAQDLCAETFQRAIRNLPGFKNQAFRPWHFTIAHNAIHDELRRANRTQPLEEATTIASLEDGPETLAISALDRESLVEMIARLPEEQRHVLVLRMEGLSVDETATALQKSRSAIYQNFHRAVLRLGQLMREETNLVEGGSRHA